MKLQASRARRHDRGMAKGQVRDHQWAIIVDAKLDAAAKKAAKEAGLPLAAWVRQVVKLKLGLPTL